MYCLLLVTNGVAWFVRVVVFFRTIGFAGFSNCERVGCRKRSPFNAMSINPKRRLLVLWVHNSARRSSNVTRDFELFRVLQKSEDKAFLFAISPST